ncbi:MAG: DUF2079 domain-containing protein [Tychonema bourrellyi B0820]|uniref:DUF2079 domain-containing protein n=1 Tax=Tychonema bourrellyi FEM_GT703 TaxID=2040638 RepID=A0A2G4F4C6_9CYAN|nr:DUF2079 domain-containing protein [Tychonema bourrellyi]MDQ2099043.1 DUF2079 domain-containing protein [Tychonema bourrellyi B0820]PHX56610.1 DUF2079 domain-containing protein [Tychonema bourrellyi FEM_GT703]
MQNSSNFVDSDEESNVSNQENVEKGRSRPPSSLLMAIAIFATILFLCSSLRHALFQSTAFDLGIFDQAIYLISQNQTPFSSLMQMHILGDHAAVIYYPLALLYKIYPDVHWLFLVQAVALSLGALPSWSLARLAGLTKAQSRAIAFIYLLYPVVFNINLFDFHPEVIALPALLAAILAARLNKIIWFGSAVLLVLSCKAVLSLTVAAMGFWLLVCEKKRRCGAIAILLGIAWFLIASQKIIPLFSGSEVAGVGRYSYLGKSVLEIVINLILKPQLVLGKFLSFDTFKYIFILSLPVIWGLLPFSRKTGLRYLTPLIPAIPTLAINILSDLPFQRSLAYQYSVPIIPFLLLAVISKEGSAADFVADLADVGKREGSAADFVADLADVGKRGKFSRIPQFWLGMQLPKTMIIWSLIIFLFLGEYKDFFLYLNRLDTWQATREAIAQIQPQSSILTDNRLAPHFTHRPIVKLLSQISPQTDLAEFQYILLNQRHPWPDTAKIGNDLANQLQNTPKFQLTYQKNQVLLFKRIPD